MFNFVAKIMEATWTCFILVRVCQKFKSIAPESGYEPGTGDHEPNRWGRWRHLYFFGLKNTVCPLLRQGDNCWNEIFFRYSRQASFYAKFSVFEVLTRTKLEEFVGKFSDCKWLWLLACWNQPSGTASACPRGKNCNTFNRLAARTDRQTDRKD